MAYIYAGYSKYPQDKQAAWMQREAYQVWSFGGGPIHHLEDVSRNQLR